MLRLTLLAAVTSIALAAGSAQGANLLINGGFEDAASTTPWKVYGGCCNTYDSANPLPGWAVNSGSVDIVFNGTPWSPAYEGNNALDIVGETQGSISQSFNTVLGRLYTVSFAYSRNLAGAPYEAKALVELGNISHAVVASAADDYGTMYHMKWKQDGFTFTGNGGVQTLTLRANDGANACCQGGVFFDSVSVQGVPEPATWAMMIGGFGAAGALLRCRRVVPI